MLELVDEVDSKAIGLIPRAGSTPATGTIFAPKCHASEHFLLLRSKILNIFRKRRKNCICRRDLTGKIQMRVNIGSGADVAVPQPFLNLLQAHTIGIEQTGTAMPLRYNYDKPEKPRISRGFGYLARFFTLFQTGKSSREVVISWGGYSNDKNKIPFGRAVSPSKKLGHFLWKEEMSFFCTQNQRADC